MMIFKVLMERIPHQLKDPKGFTLIEAVAILIVIGVLAAVATTRFISTGTISVRAAAEMIQADIRYVQQIAMSTHVARSINFVGDNTTYIVDGETRELPSGVTITAGSQFTFSSLGEPITGGGQSVSVSDGTNTNTVTVVDYTGKVSMS